jgi:acyl dehydratase
MTYVSTHIAVPDPPETIEANPIHGAAGAAAAGYAGALVAGVHTYGWATAAVLDAFGDRWLEDGWADVAYRRPVYDGDELVTTATVLSDRLADSAAADGVVSLRTMAAGERPVLDGSAGVGRATWFDELEVPEWRDPEPPVAEAALVRMELASAPLHRDFRPMAVDATRSFATAWASTRLGDDDPRWYEGDHPYLHPSFLAGRMTPLFRHNYRYGPAIHVRTRIQHLAPARAGQCLTVAARLHAAYERKGHHYHESDCWIFGEDGTALAAKRHIGIFKLAETRGAGSGA